MTSNLGHTTVHFPIYGHPSRKHVRIIRRKISAEKPKKCLFLVD